MKVTRRDVPVDCPDCKKGVLVRIDLSRLEEGLGHEGYRCDKCGYRIKRVPEAS